jgi:hypothetical protein
MAPSRPPRRRPEAPSAPTTTITELARRYHSCAVALATSLGLPLTEAFLRDHRESVSSIFIAADRAGVRLPSWIQLPPLTAPPVEAPAEAGEIMCSGIPSAPEAPTTNGDTPPPPITAADLPTSIPAGLQLPCAEALIADLRPAQLALLCGKVSLRALAEKSLEPLHVALLAERARRFEGGKKPTPDANGHGT